eukprot:1139875-Pelagomonas_calceolata.AAC.2
MNNGAGSFFFPLLTYLLSGFIWCHHFLLVCRQRLLHESSCSSVCDLSVSRQLHGRAGCRSLATFMSWIGCRSLAMSWLAPARGVRAGT